MDSLNLSETTSNTGTAFELGALTWGQSYLMCPPDHFGVLYEINPWMHRDVVANKDLAYEQWHNLVINIEKAGGMVATMEPVESLPDIVFAANAGMVDRHRFVVSRFRYPERQPEAIHDAAWFQAKGFEPCSVMYRFRLTLRIAEPANDEAMTVYHTCVRSKNDVWQ